MKSSGGAFALVPNFGYTRGMLDRYDELMSQKDERDRALTGPRPERTTSEDRHQMNFRVEPQLFTKLVALAKIEDGINRYEKGSKAAHVSTNAQLHHIL